MQTPNTYTTIISTLPFEPNNLLTALEVCIDCVRSVLSRILFIKIGIKINGALFETQEIPVTTACPLKVTGFQLNQCLKRGNYWEGMFS